MFFRVQVILETPHLVLRQLSLDDLDFVAEMLAHPEVMHFWPRPYTRDEATDWIRRQQERYVRDGFGYWLAFDKTTGQPIGQTGLLRQELDGVIEIGIGYMLHRLFWGQGYATEAAAGCRDHAFFELGKARVTATVRPENLASRRVAERIGLKFERMTTWADLPHMLYTASRPAPPPTGVGGFSTAFTSSPPSHERGCTRLRALPFSVARPDGPLEAIHLDEKRNDRDRTQSCP